MAIFNQDEQQFLNFLKCVLENGEVRKDRTGTGVKSIFGHQFRFSLLNNTFPMMTTRQMFARIAIEEMLFFISGKRQTKELEAKRINIWKKNTSAEFLKQRNLPYEEGDLGLMYGVQWRGFGSTETTPGVDQLKRAFELIKNDPTSRRIVVSAYNPQQLHLGVLEPCHIMFQFYVSEGKYLSCHVSFRSNDLFLGCPTNIQGYSILTHLMAKATGLEAKELIYTGADMHLYLDHLNQAAEQASREPFPFPKIEILKDISSIEDMEKLSFEDFKIIGYECHPAIKAVMSA